VSYNGSGTFNINSAGQPVVSGTVISSTAFNALTADLATGLSTALTKDGQTTPTANIKLGNFKITGVGAPTLATDGATLATVQNSQGQLVLTIAGTNTITAVGSPTLTAYAAGQTFRFISAGANTGATTLNIDSLGAKNVYWNNAACTGGEIANGALVTITYDGTQFQLTTNYSVATTTSIQNSAGQLLGTIAGTNTITANATPTLAAYTAGQTFRFTSAGANTGATTLNINSLGAKNVYWKGAACIGSEIANGALVTVTYDGTQFNLVTNYTTQTGTVLNGQCQLQYVGTTSIKLIPWNGNLLTVNGVSCTVPDAGVTVANTGLTASTKYYVYAVATAGAISSIECSATAYAVSTTAGNKGVVIKSADDTRTLVGMVYMNAGTPGTFGNSVTWQGVRSWFNDLGMAGNNGLASNKSTSSTTWVKLDSTTDITFLTWTNELVQCFFNAGGNSSAGSAQGCAIGIDGTSAEDGQGIQQSANYTPISGTTPARALSEGNHTASLLAAQSGGVSFTVVGAAAPTTSPTVRSTFGVFSKGINP